MKKGKKVVSRFSFEDIEFIFSRFELTSISRPTEMRRVLISFSNATRTTY